MDVIDKIRTEVSKVIVGQSNVVEIIAQSLLNNGSGTIIRTIVVLNQGNADQPFQILSWKQEERAGTSLFSADMEKFLVTQNAES